MSSKQHKTAYAAPIRSERLMNFPSAIAAIIAGKQVAKMSWNNSDYCQLRGSWLMINRDGEWHRWLINDGDMLGVDWFVVGSSSDLH